LIQIGGFLGNVLTNAKFSAAAENLAPATRKLCTKPDIIRNDPTECV